MKHIVIVLIALVWLHISINLVIRNGKNSHQSLFEILNNDSIIIKYSNTRLELLFNINTGYWRVLFSNHLEINLGEHVVGESLEPANFDIIRINNERSLLFFYSNNLTLGKIENILDIYLLSWKKGVLDWNLQKLISVNQGDHLYANYKLRKFTCDTIQIYPISFVIEESFIIRDKLRNNYYHFVCDKTLVLKKQKLKN